MINQIKLVGFIFTFIVVVFSYGGPCRPVPYTVELRNLKGFVIGKEICNTDESKDYWLIDFTFGTDNLNVGDTLVLNGTTYTNVLKTAELGERLKIIGMRVSIDYTKISANKTATSNCSVASAVTYNLKEFSIHRQGEMR